MSLLLIIGVVLVVWLGVPALLGWCAYQATRRRWHQVAVTALGLWLPFWDVAPGYLLYRQAIRETGGIRIVRVLEAEGYLDGTQHNCSDCWTALPVSPHAYIEVEREIPDVMLAALTATPGYCQYGLAARGSAECAPFDGLPRADAIREQTLLEEDECVFAVRRDTPISRYEGLAVRSAPVYLSGNTGRQRFSDSP